MVENVKMVCLDKGIKVLSWEQIKDAEERYQALAARYNKKPLLKAKTIKKKRKAKREEIPSNSTLTAE